MNLKGRLRNRAIWIKVGRALKQFCVIMARGTVRLFQRATSPEARAKYSKIWKDYQYACEKVHGDNVAPRQQSGYDGYEDDAMLGSRRQERREPARPWTSHSPPGRRSWRTRPLG